MKIRLAAAQHAITAFDQLTDRQHHTERWIADAVRQGAQWMLFTEYGSMELTSLLPEAWRYDLYAQVSGFQRLQADLLDTFSSLARQWNVVIIAPTFPVQEADKIFKRAFVFSPSAFLRLEIRVLKRRLCLK